MIQKLMNIINKSSEKERIKLLQEERDKKLREQQERDKLQIATFKSILDFADALVKNNIEKNKNASRGTSSYVHPLVDLVKLLGRKVQTEALTALMSPKNYINDTERPLMYGPRYYIFSEFCRINEKKQTLNDLQKECPARQVNLQSDLVLPWPWNKSRLLDCMTEIGDGKCGGSWRADDNHRVILWLPLGIAWVEGGNHSIATGIIQGKGMVTASTYDISAVYDYVECDGLNYYRKEDKKIIADVKNVEFAAIFEIGRMMKEYSISY